MLSEINVTVDKLQITFNCPFCHNTGIAKCFDFATKVPNGNYILSDLIKEYGYYTECPEGCIIMN